MKDLLAAIATLKRMTFRDGGPRLTPDDLAWAHNEVAEALEQTLRLNHPLVGWQVERITPEAAWNTHGWHPFDVYARVIVNDTQLNVLQSINTMLAGEGHVLEVIAERAAHQFARAILEYKGGKGMPL